MIPNGPPARTARAHNPGRTSISSRPWPSAPITCPAGISQSWKTNSARISLPRMPILSSFCETEKPFMPRSIRKAVMPFGPAFGNRSWHRPPGTSASGALVIQNLDAGEDVFVAALLRPSAAWTPHRTRGPLPDMRERSHMFTGDRLGQIAMFLFRDWPSGGSD